MKKQQQENKILISLGILSLIGFFDAFYLTLNHYLGTNLGCRIFVGCDQVTTSTYSILLGVFPVALLGVGFYLFTLVATIAYWQGRQRFWRIGLLIASFSALVFSVWFTFLQFFVIKALCQYCLLSALLATIIFILNIVWEKIGPATGD